MANAVNGAGSSPSPYDLEVHSDVRFERMNEAQGVSGVTQLNDGRVMIFSGYESNYTTAIHFYNPYSP